METMTPEKLRELSEKYELWDQSIIEGIFMAGFRAGVAAQKSLSKRGRALNSEMDSKIQGAGDL